jgi:hypothetical protein
MVQAGTRSEEARIITARDAVVEETHLERDTVVRYHMKYRLWLKTHPQT